MMVYGRKLEQLIKEENDVLQIKQNIINNIEEGKIKSACIS